jgi:hypothetical protein
MESMIKKLKKARSVGVPIIQIHTSDDLASVEMIKKNFDDKPIISFDCVSGLKAINDSGLQAYNAIIGNNDPVNFTDPIEAFRAIEAVGNSSEVSKLIFIVMGFQRLLKDLAYAAKIEQAIFNLRNPFKASLKTLILLSPIGTSIPSDLSQDILLVVDELPDESRREEIAKMVFETASNSDSGFKIPTNGIMGQVVKVTRGLSEYAVEQSIALSCNKDGIDLKVLQERWKQAINSVPGLTIDESETSEDDIRGLENIKNFGKNLLNGRDAPSAIIRIEEIEKALAGSGYSSGGVGDSSGTTQGIVGELLTFMEEENCSGLVAIGPAGSGKSLCSVALGSFGKVRIPTITLNIGALKGGIVGQTEGNVRKALATIKALAGKNTFWVASCNSSAALPPELQRRFTFGRWFFDLPSADEKNKIWDLWIKKTGVKNDRPVDNNWTGAEIRNCCQIAYRLNITPKDAAQWIIPVAQMAPEQIQTLRTQANGRYLSANKPGVYKIQDSKVSEASVRKMELN